MLSAMPSPSLSPSLCVSGQPSRSRYPLNVSGWLGHRSTKSEKESESESGSPPAPLPGGVSGQPSVSSKPLCCSFRAGHWSRWSSMPSSSSSYQGTKLDGHPSKSPS